MGRVVSTLEGLGLTRKTVIIFTSDNGGLIHGRDGPTGNQPLRAGKGSAYEGGVRVPAIVSWPGHVPAGAKSSEPMITCDLYPTVLEITGAPGDANHNARVDGVSLVPVLTRGRRRLKRSDLFWHYPHYGNQGGDPSSIIRRGVWKLIHYWEDGSRELYNIHDDLSETTDLAAQHPQRADAMSEELAAWLKEVEATIPRPDSRFDEAKHAANEQRIRTQLKPRLEQQHARMLDPKFSPGPTWWGSLKSND